ncbi:MAG: magnesium/cobalt transporter CorA [Chromatiaceae bacterium]
MLSAYKPNGPATEAIEDAGRLMEAAWIDVAEPTEEERAVVATIVSHALSEEEDADEIEASSRSFVDESGLHISTLFLHRVEGHPENTSVTVVLGPAQLITLHDRDVPAIRLLRIRARRRADLLADPLALLATLFETAVEDLGDTLQELYRALEETSHMVLQDPDADLEDALARLANHENVNGKVRLCLMDARRDLAFVLRNAQPSKSSVKRLKNLLSDIDALLPHNNYLFEKVNFLLQASQGFINIEQNQIIKIFSVAAVAFLPPTLIASIYGMNFHHMPELDWIWGYPISLGVMLVSALLPYVYFKRKGWL